MVRIDFARELERENVAMRLALMKAKELIESEYCSHDGPCGADNPKCYANFIYKALA